MLCCANCFSSNPYITELITSTGATGACNYCRSQSVPTLATNLLSNQFEFLISIYEESSDDQGSSIIECLINDWEIFAGVNPQTSLRLLCDIVGDPTLENKIFKPIALEEISPKEKWLNFCKELIYEFRFFPNDAPQIDDLFILFQHLQESLVGKIYRARIQAEQRFKPKQMGMPPVKLARGGRANPVGIPYFYASSDIDTALAETRPHPGNVVSVCRYQIIDGLSVVNLINPKQMVSPFKIAYEINDENALLRLRYDVEFLTHLGEVLSKPITPDVAELEYLPTQYLCELIKKKGFDGVKFKSSLGTGVNFALFNESKIKPLRIQSYLIKNLIYEKQKQD